MMDEVKYPISEAQIVELERLNASHGGIRCVDAILRYLRANDPQTALVVRINEGDKTRQYPDIEEHLHQMFGCRSHQTKDCDDWLCGPIRERRLKELARHG